MFKIGRSNAGILKSYVMLQECRKTAEPKAHGGALKLPPMPIELQVISSAMLKGKIYITGIATEKEKGSSQIQVYSISEHKWSMLPAAQNYNAPIIVINDCITMVGGRARTTNKPSNILSTWFEEEGAWRRILPSMPSGRVGSGLYYHDNLLTVAGGVMDPAEGGKNEYEVVNTVVVYSDITKQWSCLPALQLPKALRSPHLVSTGGCIYLVAGAMTIPARVEDGEQPFNSQAWRAQWSDIKDIVEQAAAVQPSLPGRSVWTPIADPPALRSVAIVHEQSLLLVGGVKGGSPQDAICRFDNVNDQWIIIGSMGEGRYRHAVIPVPAFVIAGGYVRSKPEEDEANVKTHAVDLVLCCL